MKIAFDAKRAFRNSSGLGNYSRNVIRQLCEYYPENEYFLFTPSQSSIEPGFPPAKTQVETPPGSAARAFAGFWRSYGMVRQIRNLKPDIFHGLSNELPFNIKSSGTKSIVTIHDLIFIRFPHLYKPVDRFIYQKKFLKAVENANLVIAASEQTRKDIIHFFNAPDEKIKVVYQSGNPIFNQMHSKEEIRATLQKYDLPGEYILCVGTLEERKNQLQIIKALHQGNIDIPLVLAGRVHKKYSKELYDYIATNNVENIFFLNRFPTAELPALYQGASLFVYPSSFEGFGIPVLEAIQSGIPVIAGAGHCLEETGGPGSVYVNPNDIESFSEIIKNTLQNSELRKSMISTGKKHSLKFLPEVTVKNLMEVYESIL